MAGNWKKQPRGRDGRWWASERKNINLHLRLSNAAIDRLLYLQSAHGLTKTEIIEAALMAYTRPMAAARPPGDDIFVRHAQQLARRRRRR